VETLEEVLSTSSNRRLLSEAHLWLAKCHKGLGDLKTSISCCNSAIEQNSKWKEPYLYRSATFQALHTAFLETEGDTSDNIARDRASADIIVDTSKEPSDVTRHREEEAKRRSPSGSVYLTTASHSARQPSAGAVAASPPPISSTAAAQPSLPWTPPRSPSSTVILVKLS